jgi:hypothetical protein
LITYIVYMAKLIWNKKPQLDLIKLNNQEFEPLKGVEIIDSPKNNKVKNEENF